MKIGKIETDIYGAKKRLLIRLHLCGVIGELKVIGGAGCFSLLVQKSDSFSVTSVEADGSTIIIRTNAVYNALSGLEDCELCCKPDGKHRIIDGEGHELCGFESLPLFAQGNYTPYFHCGDITAVERFDKKFEQLAVSDIPSDERFMPFVCNANVIQPRVLNKMRGNVEDGVCFIRFRLRCAEAMDVRLLWGCSGKLRYSVDGDDMVGHSSERLLFASHCRELRLTKGEHTIIAAFCNTLSGRGDKGITLRLERTDSDGELPMLVRGENAEYFFNV